MAKSIQLYNELEEKIFPFSLTTLIYDENGEVLEERLAGIENSIPAKINDLTDVSLASLADGQSLVYDASKKVWVNKKIDVYTLPLASTSTRGGIKIGFSATYQSGSHYNIPLELSNEKAFVKMTKAMVATALGYTPMNKADFSWSELGSKPTTLAGYGITDAVLYENEIDPTTTGVPAVMGYRSSAGWKSGGPVMLWGKTGYYTRLNVAMEKSDSPKMYISNVYANTEYDWALFLTDKSIGEHAIAIESDGNNLLVGDKQAKTGYVFGQNGWKAVGPAMTFPQGNYKGLLNMAMYNPATADNGVSAYLGVVYAGSQGKWSLILTEHNIGNYAALKATTLAGYGITDGIVYSDYINLDSAYRHIGYGYASIGWKTSGPAAVFGTALYNLRMQCAISNTDTPNVYVSQMYNGVAKEWAELVTYEGAAGKGFEALSYKIGETYVLHRSGNDTFLNYGNRTTGDLHLYGKNLRFSIDGGSSYSLRILNDGSLLIHDIALTKGTSNSLKAGGYEALQYFADGKLIMHRNAGAENLYFNYGGAAEHMYLYGSMYGFHIGASRERAFTIDSNKDASFAANLTVVGDMYSKNYPSGKALSQDPTSAFISTIFDADAVSDSSYRMKILRSGLAYDRFNAAYSPILTIKASDTHGFISFGYNSANKDKCYIGAGIGDAVNWSGILFHDNMSLIPKDDGAFYLGYSDKRWRTLNAVNVSANGLFGYVPNGGTYQQYRVFYEGDKLYIQAGSQDGLSTVGKLAICGIYSATLENFTIYSQQTLFSGAVQVNGTSQFVSLATFDAGLKIGDATITWDASVGMLKIDKGIYSDGAITAGKKS